jgi:gliding motility-associated-like protein
LVCGELAGSGTITPSGGTPPYNYYWSNQEITQTATYLPAGTVYATVTDSHDCVEEIELEVQKTGKILADYQIIEENLCYNDSLAVVYLTLPEGSEPVQYLWENGFEGQTQSDLAEGYYYVTILDKYNCGDTLNVYVSHPDSINPNITKIQPSCSGVYDGSLISEPTGGTPDYTYLWSDGSNENEFTEIREGIYYLTITDQNLCIFEFIYELEEAQYCIFVYNTFTPNGDGVNDTWIIENIEEFRFNQVWVYNRIGNPVYHSEFYQNNWDGTFNGNELPAGTYYYIIDLGTGRESIKGHVTIIR